MSIAFLFWLIMLICLIFGGYGSFSSRNWGLGGMNFIVWVLLFILGWHSFGFPIHG